MPRTLTIELPDVVREEDVSKMIAALASFRGERFWYDTENVLNERRCLSPMVLHNMKLKMETGSGEWNLLQIKNLINSALIYEATARAAAEELEVLKAANRWAEEFTFAR